MGVLEWNKQAPWSCHKLQTVNVWVLTRDDYFEMTIGHPRSTWQKLLPILFLLQQPCSDSDVRSPHHPLYKFCGMLNTFGPEVAAEQSQLSIPKGYSIRLRPQWRKKKVSSSCDSTSKCLNFTIGTYKKYPSLVWSEWPPESKRTVTYRHRMSRRREGRNNHILTFSLLSFFSQLFGSSVGSRRQTLSVFRSGIWRTRTRMPCIKRNMSQWKSSHVTNA